MMRDFDYGLLGFVRARESELFAAQFVNPRREIYGDKVEAKFDRNDCGFVVFSANHQSVFE